MKKIILLSFIFCSLSIFSQDNEKTLEFDEIILDGKTAYMNIVTGEIVTEVPLEVSNSTSSTNNTSNLETHYVKSGETLYAISRKYGISITKLKELNANIDFNDIKVNQKININNTVDVIAPNEYVVKNGNTLYAISNMFSISVDDLKRLNNLNSTIISVGQKLRIKK
jgi:LysM repeat protein